jgi:hypothetical protein
MRGGHGREGFPLVVAGDSRWYPCGRPAVNPGAPATALGRRPKICRKKRSRHSGNLVICELGPMADVYKRRAGSWCRAASKWHGRCGKVNCVLVTVARGRGGTLCCRTER